MVSVKEKAKYNLPKITKKLKKNSIKIKNIC